MKPDELYAALRRHVQAFFAGHRYEEEAWTLGPAPDVLPWLRVACLSPRAFKVEHGLEALEQRFDACGLEYWKPSRASVA
jgi:hypothetical protein